MKNKGTQFLTEAAVIGAIYVVLTLYSHHSAMAKFRFAFRKH